MQEELKRVLLKDIVPDPNQPRKHFPEIAHHELTDSIREQGVKQPILLRPTKSKNKGKYMIVAGERRYRASKAAGLEDIPAMIQEMSDKEALDVQITENLQRENINPMEEAQAFQNVVKGKVYSVEGLAARLGKRADYVRQRLRYCDLVSEWQEVLLSDKLRIADANILCRFPADQQQIYSRNVPKEWQEKPAGWVVIGIYVQEKTKNLDEATFKTEDPSLNPAMGACGQCRYNSAVSQLPFEDQKGSRICSNTTCYAIKERNSHKQKLEEVVKAGDCLLIAGSTYYPESKEQLQQAQQMSKEVLVPGNYEVLNEPVHMSRKQYEDRYSWKVDGKPEEKKQELYAEYEQEVAKEEAEYNFKKQHSQKAFVVASDFGQKAGEMVDVYVRQPEPEAIAKERNIEQEIEALQERKQNQIEEANKQFLKDLVDLLYRGPAYWDNEKPLELKDLLAIFQILIDSEGDILDQELTEGMLNKWGKPGRKTEEIISQILATGNTGLFYKQMRQMVVHYAEEAGRISDACGLSLRLLAERYLPKELEALQKLYKGKQKEIIDSTNKAIAALQQIEILEAA